MELKEINLVWNEEIGQQLGPTSNKWCMGLATSSLESTDIKYKWTTDYNNCNT